MDQPHGSEFGTCDQHQVPGKDMQWDDVVKQLPL